MFNKRQSFICVRALALWIAVVAVMAGCGGSSSQTTSGQGNISVSVNGLLANTSVVLQNNGGDNLTISANGTSSFNRIYAVGSTYSITVLTQPLGETCTVTSNSSGVIPNAVVLVAVTCIPNAVGGTLLPVPSVTGINYMPIAMDSGPSGIANRQINVPYVSVTVCPPNSSGVTPACQTIDHVQLDTGSTGLRLLNSALYSNLNLPSANPNGPAIGECTTFGVGVTWGSVVLADIYLGGKVASNVPIQNIGAQPGGVTAVPADCSNTGAIQITQDALGANGILGVGLFVNDCDLCLQQPVPATYYTCYATGCTNTSVTQFQVVQNPVASFAADNNGVVISLPAVTASGASAPFGGTLIFGIGTNPSNNFLGSAVVYATDAYGTITTTYNGSTYTSFIDSGSNALFFDDASIPLCKYSTWAYCPLSPFAVNATNIAATGTHSGPVSVSIVGVDPLVSSVVAANIGGPAGGYFDWGLPFFFGRPVYTAISGRLAAGISGPYFAY